MPLKSQWHVYLCFWGTSPAEVPKARTVPSHPGHDNSLSASVYAKEVPDPLRQPELDYPVWYWILKSCKHIILHTCFFQSSKTVCLYSSISNANMHILQQLHLQLHHSIVIYTFLFLWTTFFYSSFFPILYIYMYIFKENALVVNQIITFYGQYEKSLWGCFRWWTITGCLVVIWVEVNVKAQKRTSKTMRGAREKAVDPHTQRP